MKRFIYFFSLCYFSILNAQIPEIEWAKCYGGSEYDRAFSIVQMENGGYIVTGQTNSDNGDVTQNYGQYDAWIVILDGTGNIMWQRTLGGSDYDVFKSVQQTSDGGYILAGSTGSDDHDITEENHGFYDFWIVKMSSSGYIEWQKVLGGSSRDDANFIQQTNDGGFIVVGNTASNDGDVSGNHNEYVWEDYWVVKLDSLGNIEWQKCFGGSDDDYAYSVVQAADGGYIVAGASYSIDGDVPDNHSSRSDYFVVKLDTSGNVEWKKAYGGSDDDWATSILQTNDDGYIVFGYSSSNNGDVTNENNTDICWIVKLDSSGNLIWEKSVEDSMGLYVASANHTSDGGYILAGLKGWGDFWAAKIDPFGNVIWLKIMGGSEYDEAFSVQQTNDFGYILAGYSASNDGDVTDQHGLGDFWVVKLDSDMANIDEEESNKISIYPIPAKNSLNFSEVLFDIEIFSFEGKKIISVEESNQINISKFPDGIYFLKAKTIKGNTINKKFMKN